MWREDTVYAYKVLVRKPKETATCVTHTDRWEDNITMDLKGIRWDGMNWIHLAQNTDQWWAFVNMVTNLRVL
jgi:hypothetical protein